MPAAMYDASAARVPLAAVPLLAELRAVPGVALLPLDDHYWVLWDRGDEPVLRRLLALASAEFYLERQGRWYRIGSSLPAFHFPDQAGFKPLAQVLFPAPFRPVPPGERELRPTLLGLVPETRPRPVAALEGSLSEVARWADTVPAHRLTELRAAARAGRVLLRGSRLPALAGGTRFWGQQILKPLGFRTAPDWPEDAMRQALGLGDGEVLILDARSPGAPARVQLLAGSAFGPVTRASLHLAGQEEG